MKILLFPIHANGGCVTALYHQQNSGARFIHFIKGTEQFSLFWELRFVFSARLLRVCFLSDFHSQEILNNSNIIVAPFIYLSIFHFGLLCALSAPSINHFFFCGSLSASPTPLRRAQLNQVYNRPRWCSRLESECNLCDCGKPTDSIRDVFQPSSTTARQPIGAGLPKLVCSSLGTVMWLTPADPCASSLYHVSP